jgi:hypothetical protein
MSQELKTFYDEEEDILYIPESVRLAGLFLAFRI